MSDSPDIVRFGVFELDRRAGELRKAGVRLSLQPQPLRVLSFLVEHPGELVTREELRRQLWPDDTFVDFQHGLNAAVNRLRETLGDSAETPSFIETVPRRGYRFVAGVEGNGRPAASTAAPAAAPAGRTPRLRVGAGAMALVIVAGAAWWASRPVSRSELPVRVHPLTTLRGHEYWPALSPDGSEVAFAWGGVGDDNFDIYVAVVGRPEVRRLTTDALEDAGPSWSPDGRQLAYVRAAPLRAPLGESLHGHIHVTSPVGGVDWTLSDVLVRPPVAWSSDGRSVAAGCVPGEGPNACEGITLFPLEGGAPRALTRPKPPVGHMAPAFSRDGGRLAYASCVDKRCGIEVLRLDPALRPAGEAARVTPAGHFVGAALHGIIGSLAWTHDSRSILYCSTDSVGAVYLWTIAADGSRPPERLDVAGIGAMMPSAAWRADRIAFVRWANDVDLFEYHPAHGTRPVVGSTFIESDARFSPDGRRVAFASARSGRTTDVWIADRDGGDVRLLARGPNIVQGSPSWSPDGRRIAFDSLSPSGFWNVWMVDTDGGTPRQLTNGAGHQAVPSWSRDGRSLYYAGGPESGAFAIWRMPVEGGAARRITPVGTGRLGLETADGTHLVYQASDADSPLLVMPVSGGTTRQLVPCALNSAFGVGPGGVYYVPCEPGADPPLRVVDVDVDTGADRLLGGLERLDRGFWSLGLSVAPDGESVLYPRTVTDTSDLMLIENVR